MKILNAFSLSMLPDGTGSMDVRGPQDAAKTREDLGWAACDGDRPVSAIGHADTARLVGGQLDCTLAVNRVSVKLALHESALVAQYQGPRLPEGATELPQGAVIQYYWVTPRPPRDFEAELTAACAASLEGRRAAEAKATEAEKALRRAQEAWDRLHPMELEKLARQRQAELNASMAAREQEELSRQLNGRGVTFPDMGRDNSDF